MFLHHSQLVGYHQHKTLRMSLPYTNMFFTHMAHQGIDQNQTI
jgi:hypothetical protein